MFPSPLLTWVVAIAVTQMALLITTIYLHRALAHHSVTLSPGVAFFCRLYLWTTTGIKPRQWVAVHRQHHAHSDEEGDPHSPRLLGYAKVQFGNAWLYRRVAKNPVVMTKYARDLPPDRWDRILFDHALIGLVIGIGLFCALVGPKWGLIGSAAHAAAYLLLSAAVNAVGHLWGRRPYANFAGNSQWLAWLTAGEGLHNNHHALPTSARLALSKGEIDPGWWAIRMLERLGWARVRQQRAKVLQTAA
ncbi:MAG: fatty acid desaturase [Actinomycetota bacterium]|nr:fatty acid desaturase [Actinomycetota bacterium]